MVIAQGKSRWKLSRPKVAFNRKISFLTIKLNIEYGKKLVRSSVLSVAPYGSKIWTIRKLERKYLESFKIWCWKKMEKIKWTEKVTNEQVLKRIGQNKILLNILHRKANWIGHILRRNCLLLDAIEGQMMKMLGVEGEEEKHSSLIWETEENIGI